MTLADIGRVVVAPWASSLGLALVCLIVGIVGGSVVLGSRWMRVSALRSLTLVMPLGTGVVATAAFLGALGGIGPGGGLGLLLVGLTPRLWRERAVAIALVKRSRRLLALVWRRRPGLLIGVGVAVGWVSILTLYPSLAFDANTYHLPWVERLASGRHDLFAETLRVPVFPLLAETIWALVWPLGGDRAVHATSTLVFFAVAGTLVVWGRERFRGWWALLPAGLWLGHPIAVRYAATGYVEGWSVWFTVAALYALDLIVRERISPRRGWGVVGLLGGWALAIKYLGGLVVAAVAPWVLWRPSRFAAASCFGIGLLGAAASWYGWIVAATTNPVFPFAAGVFGMSAWSELSVGPGLAAFSSTTWLDLVKLPWNLVVDRALVNQQPPYSPMVLLLLPGVVAAIWLVWRGARWIAPSLAVLGLAVLVFPALPADSRYLLPAFALFGMVLTAVLHSALAGPGATRSLLPRLLVVAAIAPGLSYVGFHLVRLGPIPWTQAAEEQLLARELPMYSALLWIDQATAPTTRIFAVGAENLTHLARRPISGEVAGPYSYSAVLFWWRDPVTLDRVLCGFDVDVLLVPRGDRTPRRLAGLEAHPDWRLRYQDEHAQVWDLARTECRARASASRLATKAR